MVSPVPIRLGEFNRPALGNRIWGTYDVFPDLFGKHLLEAYGLRHDQNGLGVNTIGVRLLGPLRRGAQYEIEIAAQNGKVGTASHRAAAWFASVSRRWKAGAGGFEWRAEYKYASSAFDQLSPANHDKFGHEDLFGWRNIRVAKSLAAYSPSKRFSLNLMLCDFRLASARDALYNGAGKAIAQSPSGAAGRHVGDEADLFGAYRVGPMTFGAGYGYLFAGDFIRKATRGVGPQYAYIFETYSR